MSDYRPGRVNLQLWRGDTWSQTFTLTQDGDPYDLSGATAKIQVRKKPQSPDVILLIDGANCTISANVISVSKLLAIDAGEYYWDLQVTFSGGAVKTFLWGTFNVSQDVTR